MKNLHGFIMLHRKILDWRWYGDLPVRNVFIHLLLTASFKDTQWEERTLKAGQVICGRKELAAQLGLSEQQVRTALAKLQKTGEITIEATNRYSVVTLVNWALYQAAPLQSANQYPAVNQQPTIKQPHRNNVNNINNVNKYPRTAQMPSISNHYDYEKIRTLARRNIRQKLSKQDDAAQESA